MVHLGGSQQLAVLLWNLFSFEMKMILKADILNCQMTVIAKIIFGVKDIFRALQVIRVPEGVGHFILKANFCHGSANRGVGGWVSLYFLFTQIGKTVQFNGRPLTWGIYTFRSFRNADIFQVKDSLVRVCRSVPISRI